MLIFAKIFKEKQEYSQAMKDRKFVIMLFNHILVVPDIYSIFSKLKEMSFPFRKPNSKKSFSDINAFNNIDVIELMKINTMSGIDFEIFLINLFKKMGFSAVLTPNTCDHGADIILSKNSVKIAVQAKRYQGTVPNAAVMQCHYAMTHYDCKRGFVVTNNVFSNHARQEASIADIRLIERPELEKLIKKYMYNEIRKRKMIADSSNVTGTNAVVQDLEEKTEKLPHSSIFHVKNSEIIKANEINVRHDKESDLIKQETDALLRASIGNIVDAEVNIRQEDGYYEAIIKFNKPTEQDIKDIVDFAAILYFNTFYHFTYLRKGNIFIGNDRSCISVIANATLYGKWANENDFSSDGKLTDSGIDKLLHEVHEVTEIFEKTST